MVLCQNWRRSSHAYDIAQPGDKEEGSSTED